MRTKVLGLIVVGVVFSFSAFSSTKKIRIEVLPTQDRTMTFSDGGQAVVGSEVPVLIAAEMHRDSRFLIFEGQKQGSHITISASIKRFQFVSGERSNRMVFGFSENFMTPFNSGLPNSIGNEFTAQNLGIKNQCQSLDFFRGQLDPGGGGIRRSNFGATFDGIEISLPDMLEAGFKYSHFQTIVEIDFLVRSKNLNKSWIIPAKLSAKGFDLLVLLGWNQFSIPVNMQLRETLVEALDRLLPMVSKKVTNLVGDISWSTKIIKLVNKGYLINVGDQDGLVLGEILFDRNRRKFQVIQVSNYLATVRSVDGESARVGDVLFESESRVEVETKPAEIHIQIDMGKLHTNQSSLYLVKNCFGQNKEGWDEVLEEISQPLALLRYQQCYDLEFKSDESQLRGPRIALVSTGIYPKQKQLEGMLSASGHDFVSHDQRASDDTGAGTAAALYLKGLFGDRPMTLIPYKVVGPVGQTTSVAIYAAFAHIAQRTDIDEVLVPFSPSIRSRAYEEGLQRVVRSGKRVIIPSAYSYSVPGVVKARRASRLWYGKGLGGAKLRLSIYSRGVVDEAAKLYSQSYLKEY